MREIWCRKVEIFSSDLQFGKIWKLLYNAKGLRPVLSVGKVPKA